jgi:O-antigen/teichoic acid export membrane protein
MKDKQLFNKIFHYSFFIYLFDSIRSALYAFPSFLLGSFFGTASITIYTISSRLVNYAVTFSKSTSDTLVPFVSGFDAKNDFQRIKRIFMEGSKYAYVITLFASISLIFVGKPFISLWVGNDYAQSSYTILIILLLPFIFSPSMFTAISIMKGLGIVKEITFLAIIEATTAIIISYLLKKWLGILAIATGFSIPLFINYGLILPIIIMKRLTITTKEYIKNVFFPAFLPTLGVSVVFFFWNRDHYPNTYLKLLLETTCSLILGIFLFIRFSISIDERAKITRLIINKALIK